MQDTFLPSPLEKVTHLGPTPEPATEYCLTQILVIILFNGYLFYSYSAVHIM